MKFKCEICGEEVNSNDAIFELCINISTLRQEEDLGDYVHSPIYNEKICSLCARQINLILRKGIEEIPKEDLK